jgi:hypothetical protein
MRFLTMAAALCAAAIVTAASAGAPGTISWGKAGVSLPQYALDANECSDTSRYVTTYISPRRLKELDLLSSAQLLDTVMQSAQPSADFSAMGVVQAITELRSADDIARRTNTFGAKYVALISFDVRDQLQAVLDRCLVERGYTRLRLTEAQTAALRRFKRHSAARTAYLHAIDSDPAIIAAQRVPPGR